MSGLDLEDTYGDLIEINNKSSGEFRTVQVKRRLNNVLAYPIAVELDCKYVVSNDPANVGWAVLIKVVQLRISFAMPSPLPQLKGPIPPSMISFGRRERT